MNSNDPLPIFMYPFIPLVLMVTGLMWLAIKVSEQYSRLEPAAISFLWDAELKGLSLKMSQIYIPIEGRKDKMSLLIKGDQVIYVPQHANGDIEHEDCEAGFVTSCTETNVFCRFFLSGSDELRTKANSELVNSANLVLMSHHPQELIVKLLKAIEMEKSTRKHRERKFSNE